MSEVRYWIHLLRQDFTFFERRQLSFFAQLVLQNSKIPSLIVHNFSHPAFAFPFNFPQFKARHFCSRGLSEFVHFLKQAP